MPKFALKKIPLVEETIPFYTIVINGINKLEEFKIECESQSRAGYLKSCMSYLSSISTNKPLSSFTKEQLKGFDNSYRIRKDPLRLYYIKHNNVFIFILGGLKKNQTADLNKFRSIIEQLSSEIEILPD